MKEEFNECNACGQPYSYLLSGIGCNDKNNNKVYCSDCMDILNPVLKKIPKIYGKLYIDSNDYSLEEFLLERERQYTKSLLRLVQVFPELTKNDFSDSTSTFRIEMPNNKIYLVCYWKSSKKIESIRKEVKGYFKDIKEEYNQ